MAFATDSSLAAIVGAALLGTERQPFQVPNVPGRLGHYLAQLHDRPNEAALLLAVGMVSLHQRVGWLPETRSVAPAKPCVMDDLPRCSPRSARCLQQILQGQYVQLLAEWLELAAIAQQRVPEMLLPELLDKGQQQQDLRAAILPILGKRGQWLAAQNPAWSYTTALTANEADWETGSFYARLAVLQSLRSHNPDQARTLLQTTWNREAASDRAKFLATFYTGLSLADEPFLAMILGDRSKEVRRLAVDLLASLVDSRFCQQITDYTCRYLCVERNQGLSLQVKLPEQFDDTLRQLGLEPKPTAAVNAKVGEKAWWLLQMIGATPLHIWTERWQLSPLEIVQLAQSHDYQSVLLDGFALAAKRQRNYTWLEVIFKFWVAEQASIHRNVALTTLGTEDLVTAIPADRRDALLIDLFQISHKEINDSLMLWLLRYSSQQWSLDLARIVLERLEKHFQGSRNLSNSDWELRSVMKEFAHFIPVILTPEVMNLRAQLMAESYWIPSVDELLALLQFRQEMTLAFEGGRNG